jgi:tRNA(Ile)-lysidine synthase
MLSEFEKKVAAFAKANELFGSAERILLAVSGGADSTALLYVMQRLVDEGVFNTKLLCAHINHQLRGCEADLDERFVIAQARKLNLPIITKQVDVRELAHRNKLSIETSARKLRIEGLLDIAKVNNCILIATAHQKNDNAETILQRLLRGTGFRGLAGIWPVQAFAGGFTPLDNSANMDTTQNTTISNGVNPSTALGTSALRTRFVRPLLCVQRDEIIKYLQERNLKWREDHTNADCTYTRNYIRHRLLPALQADCTGSIVEQLSLLAQQGRKLNCLVREHTERVWPELARTGENTVALSLKSFLVEPKIVKVELIRRSITALGSGERGLTQHHYEGIMQLTDKCISGRNFELPGGFVVWREFGNLIFARPQRITLWHGLPGHSAELSRSPREDTAKMAVPQQITESIKLEVPGQTRFGRYLIEATMLNARKKEISHEDTKSQSQLDTSKKQKNSSCLGVLVAEGEELEEFKARKNNLVERFDLDRIKLPLVVRRRQNGDRFRPLGLAAEKKVGKFLTDARVPQKMRSKTLIIADGEKIIWVWPIRISEHAKVSSQTHKILQLRIIEAESS